MNGGNECGEFILLCFHRLNYAGRMCSFERFFSLGVLNHQVQYLSS